MAKRKVNGEGSIYQRKDGRFAGAAYVLTPGGTRKRVQVYGKTWKEAHDKLAEAMAVALKGLPVADRKVKLGDYLDYWLETFVRVNNRPKTYVSYEGISRKYIKTGLGGVPIGDLTVPKVQTFLNGMLEGDEVKLRTVKAIRDTLRAALKQAQREELLNRNVAELIVLPTYKPKKIVPWSAEEEMAFLAACQDHVLYPAFQLLVLLGLRRGEVLGLRWCDVDFERGEIRIRKSLQRIPGLGLVLGDAKTDAGLRDLPMQAAVRTSLLAHRSRQVQQRAELGSEWGGSGDETESVFTTSRGTWIGPDNFLRSFKLMCRTHDLRVIALHHIRHSLATRLKELDVPVKDAQGVLGHADVQTTIAIYQHEDMPSRAKALSQVEGLFGRVLDTMNVQACGDESTRCCQSSCQRAPGLEFSGFCAAFVSVISGASDGVRTRDLLDHNQLPADIDGRLQSVTACVKACESRWKVGVVAVNFAVKSELHLH